MFEFITHEKEILEQRKVEMRKILEERNKALIENGYQGFDVDKELEYLDKK